MDLCGVSQSTYNRMNRFEVFKTRHMIGFQDGLFVPFIPCIHNDDVVL